MSKLLIVSVALTTPYLLWAAVVLAARRNVFTLHSMLRVLTVWHWIAIIVGFALVFGFFEQPPARYGWGFVMFSFGLIGPEQWLKRRLEPPPASPIPRSSI